MSPFVAVKSASFELSGSDASLGPLDRNHEIVLPQRIGEKGARLAAELAISIEETKKRKHEAPRGAHGALPI